MIPNPPTDRPYLVASFAAPGTADVDIEHTPLTPAQWESIALYCGTMARTLMQGVVIAEIQEEARRIPKILKPTMGM